MLIRCARSHVLNGTLVVWWCPQMIPAKPGSFEDIIVLLQTRRMRPQVYPRVPPYMYFSPQQKCPTHSRERWSERLEWAVRTSFIAASAALYVCCSCTFLFLRYWTLRSCLSVIQKKSVLSIKFFLCRSNRRIRCPLADTSRLYRCRSEFRSAKKKLILGIKQLLFPFYILVYI